MSSNFLKQLKLQKSVPLNEFLSAPPPLVKHEPQHREQPKLEASVPVESVSWTHALWIECVQPHTWEDLQAFALQHVDRMELADRGVKAKPEDLTPKVLQTLNAHVEAWKLSHKGKPMCLVGAPNTGKTCMLRLLAAKHGLEFVPIHEEEHEELKWFLQSAADVGLEGTERLWVIEHFDTFDAQCRAALKAAIPKLQRSGPVFLTVWPTADLRSVEFATRVNALSFHLPARHAFLDKFGEGHELMSMFAEGGGDIGVTACLAQLHRAETQATKTMRLCDSAHCGGGCDVCFSRRRVPSNLRLLVEDTLCKRSTQRKRDMLGETDVDTGLQLLQEMLPMSSSSLDVLLKGLDALCVCDSTAGFETFVKSAFATGAVQSVCGTSSLTFGSGMTLPLPASTFAKHRATPETLQATAARILKARVGANAKQSVNVEKRKREKNVVVVEDDSKDVEVELTLDAPEAELRHLESEVSLWEAASNLKGSNENPKRNQAV